MGKRVRRREPRAHWVLLVLVMLVLLAELGLDGYVSHDGAERGPAGGAGGRTAPPAAGRPRPSPSPSTTARIRSGPPRSSKCWPGTVRTPRSFRSAPGSTCTRR